MSEQWYLNRNGHQYGPYTRDEFSSFVRSGWVMPNDYVWHSGMTEWTKAEHVEGLIFTRLPEKHPKHIGSRSEFNGSKAGQSLFRTIFGMMINPSTALRNAFSSKWYISASVSAVAFCLFFLQTGLDLYKTGQKGRDFVIMSGGVGIAYGFLIIPILAAVVWVILKVAKTDKSLVESISAFCLSYSGALIYGVLGIIVSVTLGWRTSVAFGITGVLWAISPMIMTIRDLSGGKNFLSVFVATIVCAAVLISWSIFGNL
jgi:hypothetical protein